MWHEIILAAEAVEDLRQLPATQRSEVVEAIEAHLRHTPAATSRSRIKRLRGVSKPQYRLRVGDFRVFYDVIERQVEVLAIVPKSGAADWLGRVGK
ncbi:MAG: type II toxin-antitoxin system RelE/ParE family toxin [Anaerolineales bacterium]|nr:type II toxin-antitoxin system RelE/ParE family toxin [Anaerolineales bacterium]